MNPQQILQNLKQKTKRFEKYYAPLVRMEFDMRSVFMGGFFAVMAFALLFTVLVFTIGEKPYRLFEPTVLAMPKTADLADIKNAKALLAVFVADVGLNSKVVESLKAPDAPSFTLAISAYAPDTRKTLAALGHKGYEIWLNTAIDTARSGQDAGPIALRTDNNVKSNWDLLMRQLGGSAQLIRGLLLPSDAALPYVTQAWQDLAQQILLKGYMVVDMTSAQIPSNLYLTKTQASQSAYIKADGVLNAEKGLDALAQDIQNYAAKALEKKQLTLVLANPTPKSIALFTAELQSMEKQGIAVVPASVLLTRGVTNK